MTSGGLHTLDMVEQQNKQYIHTCYTGGRSDGTNDQIGVQYNTAEVDVGGKDHSTK